MAARFQVELDSVAKRIIFLRSKWAERRLGILFDDAYQESWCCVMSERRKSKAPTNQNEYEKWLNTKIKSHLLQVWYQERHHIGYSKGTKKYDPLLFNPVEIRTPTPSVEHVVHCKMLVDLLRRAVFPCLYHYHHDLLEYCAVNGENTWWLSDFAKERNISKHTVYDRMKVMRKMVHELMQSEPVRYWYAKR